MRKSWLAIGLIVVVTLVLEACGTTLQDPVKASSKSITAFSFVGGEAAIIDQEQRVIHVNLDSRINMTGLVAIFETTGVGVSVDGVLQLSGSTPNDFSYPLRYLVIAEDGTMADYLVIVDPPLIDECCIGVLVDSFMGDIDWSAARNDMVDYAFIRARQGEFPDAKFSANWAGARAAGILRSAYIYVDFNKDVEESTNLFLADFTGDYKSFDLPPLILCEAEGATSEAYRLNWLQLCVGLIEAEIGVKPIIATGTLFWSGSMGNSDAFTEHPLMIRHYTTAIVPTFPSAWHNWAFWNYTGTGTVNGITGDVTSMLRLGWTKKRSSLFPHSLP